MNPSRLRPLRTGLAACALLLTLGGAARAQYAFDEEIMPPRALAWQLAERGFSAIGRPRFDGRAYVVEAFAPNGARLRLFVDATDGAILGRQRLDAPPTALARPAPGYGWTEEDEMPRRSIRSAERLAPPADIPVPVVRSVPPRRNLAPGNGLTGSVGSLGRDNAEANPLGGNPDARARTDTPRKLARVGTTAKVLDAKASARAVPDAARNQPVDAAKPERVPDGPVAAIEPPKLSTLPPTVPTPAAVQPPPEGAIAVPAETASAKPVGQTWKDPPEGKRVRVIGGATVVPGTADKDPGATP